MYHLSFWKAFLNRSISSVSRPLPSFVACSNVFHVQFPQLKLMCFRWIDLDRLHNDCPAKNCIIHHVFASKLPVLWWHCTMYGSRSNYMSSSISPRMPLLVRTFSLLSGPQGACTLQLHVQHWCSAKKTHRMGAPSTTHWSSRNQGFKRELILVLLLYLRCILPCHLFWDTQQECTFFWSALQAQFISGMDMLDRNSEFIVGCITSSFWDIRIIIRPSQLCHLCLSGLHTWRSGGAAAHAWRTVFRARRCTLCTIRFRLDMKTKQVPV